jgi:hypothetical protein
LTNERKAARVDEAGMSSPTRPVSNPWHRYLRFRVRGLIVVVLLVGCWLGWIVRNARIQREAVAAIKNAGGSVMYDWEWQSGRRNRGGKPRAAKWLVNTLGVDYFGDVTYVVIPRASEEELIHI